MCHAACATRLASDRLRWPFRVLPTAQGFGPADVTGKNGQKAITQSGSHGTMRITLRTAISPVAGHVTACLKRVDLFRHRNEVARRHWRRGRTGRGRIRRQTWRGLGERCGGTAASRQHQNERHNCGPHLRSQLHLQSEHSRPARVSLNVRPTNSNWLALRNCGPLPHSLEPLYQQGALNLLRVRRRTLASTSDSLMRGPANPGSGFVRCVAGSANCRFAVSRRGAGEIMGAWRPRSPSQVL